ncbi:sulfite exporter TauE/SafE family protein [Candidatus Halobeggiatoa sp. HSG11]|nr:sulfite exporter TauE/SafE family protein [Candidatus Halobeggiatoa sp. HSG11]
MDLNSEILIVAAFIFFFAAFIHGSIGFGFPMIATPLLALVTDIHTAIILTLIPTLLVNLASIASEGNILYALRRHLSLALLAMTGSAIGTLILIFTNSHIFEALLGLVIIAYLLSERIKINLSWIYMYPHLSKVVFGISAGILGGLTNVMAPILVIYSLESKYTKSEIIQASNFSFMFGKTVQLVLFSVHGKYNLSEFLISLVMLVAVSLALYLGINIKKKINANIYKRVLRAFLSVLAMTLIIKVAYNSGITIVSN